MKNKNLKLAIATKEVNKILSGRKVSELSNSEKFVLKAYLETMNFIYSK
tara:strand:- start:140 stop:286 length:147 start_codon:yes stop_codon:yes gene_type:complete